MTEKQKAKFLKKLDKQLRFIPLSKAKKQEIKDEILKQIDNGAVSEEIIGIAVKKVFSGK